MSVSVTFDEQSGQTTTALCKIIGHLDFSTAREALESVVPHITANTTLHIDLSGVTFANSAGLALLIEWQAQARRTNSDVTFHHIPDSLRQLAGVCQVDGLI